VPATPVTKHDAMATMVIRVEFEQVVSEGKSIPDALADARAVILRRARH
jgi:hypothetical protein